MQSMEFGNGQRSRTSARYSLQLPIGIDSGDGQRVPGSILNLSREGCLVSTLDNLSVGQTVRLQIPAREDEALVATVAWTGDTIYGCIFANPVSKSALRQIVEGQSIKQAEEEFSERFLSKLPQALIAARRMSGFTTTELAGHLGVSRPTLWAWESGRAVPSHDNQQRLVDFLRQSNAVKEDTTNEYPTLSDLGENSLQNIIAASRRDLAMKLDIEEHQIRISIDL